MEDLQKLMQVKLDAATVLVLQRATELCDNETFNLHYHNENPDVCLCVWGNLSKNPRCVLLSVPPFIFWCTSFKPRERVSQPPERNDTTTFANHQPWVVGSGDGAG